MVKFLSFDLFDGQNLLPSDVDEEPLDVIPALNDFLISTKGGEIIHYAIGATEAATIVNRFSTQNSTILSLHYINSSDSILTLEKDTDLSKINVVRIYQHWRQNHSYGGTIDQLGTSPGGLGSGGQSPINPGSSPTMAGGIGNASGSSQPFHVYKIPVPSSVTTINVCPVTGRVIIATEKSVSVWGNANPSAFITSFERILDIDADNVRHLAIYEGYIAYSTNTDVKILNLNIHLNDDYPLHSTSILIPDNGKQIVNNGPSEIVEDEHYFEISFDSQFNPTGKNQLSMLQTTVGVNKANEVAEYEILGPITDIDHGINVNSESGYSLLSSTLVLSKRFSKDDDLHTLFFLPDISKTSLYGGGINSSASTTQLHSSGKHNNQQHNHQQQHSITATPQHAGGSKNISMRCVISTQREGFLYNITKPSLLATYTYANETFICSAGHSFLYTITTEGLETWTLRSCDSPEDGNDIPPPIGLGLRTFLYLTKIAVIGDHLLLLSKVNQEQLNDKLSNLRLPGIMRSPSRTLSSPAKKQDAKVATGTVWSVYILHHTPLQSLYNEILEYAIKNQDRDEEVYHQLLLEGHFLLQSKLANQHRSNPNMNDMASMVNHGVEKNIYQSLLRQSSSYLGEFFLKNQKEYLRAAVWFSSSDTDIELVFNLLSENPESHKALSYYLKQVLFNPSSVELLADKEELSNRILKHYHSESPHNLSVLILESSVSSYSQVLAIDLLKNLSEQCDFDLEQRNMNYFALGLLYLDQNNFEETLSSLNQIPLDSLIALCLKNPKLLAPVGDADPSDLGKILRQSIPWGLLEIVVQLVKRKEISPDDGFTILLHSTSTFTHGVLNSNSNSYHHQDFDLDALLLKTYLEWFLDTYCKDINLNIGVTSSTTSSISGLIELVPAFVKYLIHLYVQDIHRFRGDDKKLFQSLNIDVAMIINHSTTRPKNQPSPLNKKIVTDDYCNQWIVQHLRTYTMIPQWLSKLPPFSLDYSKVNPSEREDPNNQLSSLYNRKLHSILATTHIRDFEFMENIESIFGADSDNPTYVGLKLACLPLLDRMNEAVQLIVQKHIDVILEYGLNYGKHGDSGYWSIILDQVLKRYSSVQDPKEKEIILAEYERVLDHLTNLLNPEAFLQLLPLNGKMDYFLPFIEKSFSNHHSKVLKSKLQEYLSNINNI